MSLRAITFADLSECPFCHALTYRALADAHERWHRRNNGKADYISDGGPR
jgi:hypothetical protein